MWLFNLYFLIPTCANLLKESHIPKPYTSDFHFCRLGSTFRLTAFVSLRSVVWPGGFLQWLLPDDPGDQDEPHPPGQGGRKPPLGGVWQRWVRQDRKAAPQPQAHFRKAHIYFLVVFFCYLCLTWHEKVQLPLSSVCWVLYLTWCFISFLSFLTAFFFSLLFPLCPLDSTSYNLMYFCFWWVLINLQRVSFAFFPPLPPDLTHFTVGSHRIIHLHITNYYFLDIFSFHFNVFTHSSSPEVSTNPADWLNTLQVQYSSDWLPESEKYALCQWP